MKNPGTPYRLEMRADSLSLNEKVSHLSTSTSRGVLDCHFLLQGIVTTQESKPGLLHCRQIPHWLSCEESPKEEERWWKRKSKSGQRRNGLAGFDSAQEKKVRMVSWRKAWSLDLTEMDLTPDPGSYHWAIFDKIINFPEPPLAYL